MNEQPHIIPPIPRETIRMAKAAFGSSNFYILLGEQLEKILSDLRPDNVPGSTIQKAIPILPLVTFFQFMEGLTDIQAEDAIRTRIDWKFALHLAINAPALPYNALCEYRCGLMRDAASQGKFQKLIDRLSLLNPNLYTDYENLDTMEILLVVCSINRLYLILEAVKGMLEYLAGKHAGWLREIALPHWYARYRTRAPLPRWNSSEDLTDLIHKVGMDADYLLESISRVGDAEITRSSPAQELKRVWSQHFERDESRNVRMMPFCSFCASIGTSHTTGKEGLSKILN